MNEDEIITGFDEWLRQYAADPNQFANIEADAARKRAGGAVTYGARCLETLKRCAQEAKARS